jgi:hypothetical protein
MNVHPCKIVPIAFPSGFVNLYSCWQRYFEFSLENGLKFQQRRSDDAILLARQGLLMVIEEEWWQWS